MWHLGCVTCACLAKSHEIVGCDFDEKTIANLSLGKMPIFEPGLEEEIHAAMDKGKLRFSGNIKEAAKSSDIIYITFDTPVDRNDNADITPIQKTVELISEMLSDRHIVIISSQLPIGTSRMLLGKLQAKNKNVEICYTPENLRLGNALCAFMHPTRTVFGLSSPRIRQAVEEVFAGIEGERLFMDLESAEMSKHALNSYLATLISFSGEISDLCEKSGANAILVMDALRKEKRVSPDAPLSPGLGFGGGTLARDVQVLRSLGKENGLSTILLDSVIGANKERLNYVQRRLCEVLGKLDGKTIAFFGLTYKPGTDTLRRSLALEVIDSLKGSGATLRAHDPAILAAVETHPQLQIFTSADAAAAGADAIVITTAWEEFKSLDYAYICQKMHKPVIIDARNILLGVPLAKSISYYGVGVTNAGE
ncbi:hypothetical protein AUJ17_05005 [Candidatus Micrarchaeota archaeon CG1_02_47_40]|nr:MAG: hypothetical protein AUJ17_05005 [Candidatus Micrarchaeota archaeon CG1_02_47_40]